MSVVTNFAALDENLLGDERVGYWDSLPQVEKNEMRAAFAVLQTAYDAHDLLRDSIHTVAYHAQSELEEALFASKCDMPSDVAARKDEYLRGRLDALGDVAALLTQASKQHDIINQMEAKEE